MSSISFHSMQLYSYHSRTAIHRLVNRDYDHFVSVMDLVWTDIWKGAGCHVKALIIAERLWGTKPRQCIVFACSIPPSITDTIFYSMDMKSMMNYFSISRRRPTNVLLWNDIFFLTPERQREVHFVSNGYASRITMMTRADSMSLKAMSEAGVWRFILFVPRYCTSQYRFHVTFTR